MILIGDLNCRVSKEIKDDVLGRHGEEISLDNAKRLIQICTEHKLIAANGFLSDVRVDGKHECSLDYHLLMGKF